MPLVAIINLYCFHQPYMNLKINILRASAICFSTIRYNSFFSKLLQWQSHQTSLLVGPPASVHCLFHDHIRLTQSGDVWYSFADFNLLYQLWCRNTLSYLYLITILLLECSNLDYQSSNRPFLPSLLSCHCNTSRGK